MEILGISPAILKRSISWSCQNSYSYLHLKKTTDAFWAESGRYLQIIKPFSVPLTDHLPSRHLTDSRSHHSAVKGPLQCSARPKQPQLVQPIGPTLPLLFQSMSVMWPVQFIGFRIVFEVQNIEGKEKEREQCSLRGPVLHTTTSQTWSLMYCGLLVRQSIDTVIVFADFFFLSSIRIEFIH